jgi:hypothetical protein
MTQVTTPSGEPLRSSLSPSHNSVRDASYTIARTGSAPHRRRIPEIWDVGALNYDWQSVYPARRAALRVRYWTFGPGSPGPGRMVVWPLPSHPRCIEMSRSPVIARRVTNRRTDCASMVPLGQSKLECMGVPQYPPD